MTGTRLRIERAVASVEPARGRATEARLRKLHESCGCREGAFFMLVATLGTALYLALAAPPRAPLTIVLVMIAALFAGAAVGKVVGLAVAKVQLRRLLRQIERSGVPLRHPA